MIRFDNVTKRYAGGREGRVTSLEWDVPLDSELRCAQFPGFVPNS